MSMQKAQPYTRFWLVMLFIILAACQTDPPQPEMTKTAIPPVRTPEPAVWIDQPLPGQVIQASPGSPLMVVAHASTLSGIAELQVWDTEGQLLARVNMGQPVNQLLLSGQLARYEGGWFPPSTLQAAELRLQVVVDGVASDSIIVQWQSVP